MFVHYVARSTFPRYDQASTNTTAAFAESQLPLAQSEPVTVNTTKDRTH